MAPTIWVILSDKRGDNGQVDTIVEALPWTVEHKYVHMQPQWVLGKPKYRPSLDHLDLEKSDPIEGPWPDIIITIGRRPSMVALWIRQQSAGHTRIVLVGKPSGYMMDFALVVASAENQLPPMPNFVPTTLPLMRVAQDDVEAEAATWSDRLAPLKKPLIAFLVGGQTNPFVMNRAVADDLIATAQWVVDELGGTPYVTTSRRTTPEVVAALREELPAEAVFYEWSSEAIDNPYRALLGSADGFVVTADSVSMMVEVIYLRKPLAIFPLPGGALGSLDQARRSLAHWLFNPRCETTFDAIRHRVARATYYIDVFKLLSATRDFRAFHRLLVNRGMAVWAGQPFRAEAVELPDDVGRVVQRIEALVADRA